MPELYHYGIKGQRWNDRRYQYEDGSLTPEGKIRYGVGQGHRKGKISKNLKYKQNKSITQSNTHKKNKNNQPKKQNNRPVKHFDTNKKVKDIDNRTFMEKANDFLASPTGKFASSMTLSIVGIVVGGVFKEMIKGAFNDGRSTYHTTNTSHFDKTVNAVSNAITMAEKTNLTEKLDINDPDFDKKAKAAGDEFMAMLQKKKN